VAVEILGAIDIAGDVFVGLGRAQLAVALLIELVPGVARGRGDELELGIAALVADLDGAAGAQRLAAAGGVDLGLAGAGGDLGGAVGEDLQAVRAVGQGADGGGGGGDFDLGIAALQGREGDEAAGDLEGVLAGLELG